MEFFGKVDLLLAESNSGIAEQIRKIVVGLGFKDPVPATTIAEAKSAVAANSFDLILCGTSFSDGDIFEFITELRHGVFGDDPFVPLVGINPSTDSPFAKRFFGYGADSSISVPVSREGFLRAIETLMAARRAFVVTCDYVGPDRRAGSGRESMIPLIDAPNALRDKAVGRGVQTRKTTLQAIARNVNLQKLVRYSFGIEFLIKNTAPELLLGEVSEQALAYMEELERIVRDIVARAPGTEYADAVEPCERLLAALEPLLDEGEAPSAKEVDSLIVLARTVARRLPAEDVLEEEAAAS